MRLLLDGGEVTTANFEETSWVQSAAVWVSGESVGKLEVYYLGEKPKAEEGPFLFEERNLIETIAVELGGYIERKQIERIKDQQHNELDLYASFLRHDLRNDVGVILNNVDMTRMVFSEIDEVLEEVLSSTEAVCDRMMGIPTAFSRSADMAEQDIVSLILKVSRHAREAAGNLTVNVRVEDDVKGSRVPESKLLPMIFDNLLSNAAVHAGVSPTVDIHVSREGNRVIIIVSDDGPGIAEEIRDSLFNKGVSTKGGGLGLYLSREVVRTLGGSIELVSSEHVEGATFSISLPVAS
ncbi:MAG: sensor histidine kinase [Candidatus Thorarchaeota archaeon]